MLKKFMNRFVREQEGATMVEYAIMVALIAVISILVVTALGQKVASNFDKAQQEMPDPPTPVPAT
jgi:pilus assembly protein Flp/PilA